MNRDVFQRRRLFREQLKKRSQSSSRSSSVSRSSSISKSRLSIQSSSRSRHSYRSPIGFSPVKSKGDVAIRKKIREYLVRCLLAPSLIVPIDANSLCRKIKRMERSSRASKPRVKDIRVRKLISIIEQILQELSGQSLIKIDLSAGLVVVRVYKNKLRKANPTHRSPVKPNALINYPDFDIKDELKKSSLSLRSTELTFAIDVHASGRGFFKSKVKDNKPLGITELLATKTVRERKLRKFGLSVNELLAKPTAKDMRVAERFKTKGGSSVREFCPHGTKVACRIERKSYFPCDKVHFRRVIQPHTEEKLGDCSYLNACRHMKHCKFVHYEIDEDQPMQRKRLRERQLRERERERKRHASMDPSKLTYGDKYGKQWITCDIRIFPLEILGTFTVLMADPPWDIHMELPYGTMSDQEMLNLNINCLQTDGVMLLWVTGRAMELGRDCLTKWGYETVGEILWIKTNQLQRLIRTGRTGHWLNHSKEHCLIGVKGDPAVNHGIDCDVIVSEVRETSRKPDEIYGVLNRLAPSVRKLEMFGRPHNLRDGWITLGNQLGNVHLNDPELIAKFNKPIPGVIMH